VETTGLHDVLMPPQPPATSPDVPSAPRALWTVLTFLGRRPGWVALSISLLLVNIGIELALPQFLGNAITRLQDPTAAREFPLAWSVALFSGLVLLRTLVGLVLGPIRNRTAITTLGDIRAAVYDSLQRKSFAWHDNARTGELISRAVTDVGRLQELLFVCLLFSVDVIAGLAGTLVLVFLVSMPLGWIALGSMLPTVMAMGYFAVRLQPRWRRVHDRHGAMSTVIQENIAGVRVVKAFARESAEIEKFRGRREEFLREVAETVNYWAARVPFAQFLFGLGLPLVLWVGGQQVVRGEIPLGDLVKVVFYLLGLGGRIGIIGQITNILQNASSAAQRICEILQDGRAADSGRPSGSGPLRGAIRLEEVGFDYTSNPSLRVESEKPAAPPPGRPESPRGQVMALEAVSFEVGPGETVAIVGPTGAGKTTLLSLVPGFHTPSRGRLLIDGVDVREFDPAWLRRSVAIVFQETFLFSASVADNIAFGRPQATREEVERAARAARADGFIRELAEGYDTVIGERGVSLSGGQRQRLAIARALLVDPTIVLLDDATSAVDPRTEHEIQDALGELCRGRTTLVVAHRLATVRRADRIVVLDRGRVVGLGTHEVLLRTHELYRSLFGGQTGEEGH
jgi:ATP-binding cassette subfamily B multidrug efflux pump